jgi:hypothetical protein
LPFADANKIPLEAELGEAPLKLSQP